MNSAEMILRASAYDARTQERRLLMAIIREATYGWKLRREDWGALVIEPYRRGIWTFLEVVYIRQGRYDLVVC